MNKRTHGLSLAQEQGLAIFALGRFIDYRLEEGMAAEHLADYQQAWLNLTARRDGRPAALLADLARAKVDPTPQERAGLAQFCYPAWLPEAERLRQLRERYPSGLPADTAWSA